MTYLSTKQILSLLFIVFLSMFNFSLQADNVTLSTYSYTQDGEKNSLPFIISSNKPVDFKINNFLYLDAFNTPPPTSLTDKAFFLSPGVNDITFTQLESNSNFLSLSVNYNFCGAYCEETINYYLFSTVTGNFISLKDLFTPEGYFQLENYVVQQKKDILNKTLEDIDNILFNPQGKEHSLSLDELNEQRAIYTACLEDILPSNKFTFTSNTFYIYLDKCSTHSDEAIDTLNEFKIAIVDPNGQGVDKNLLKSWLNDYGKYLVFGIPHSPLTEPSELLNKLFYGSFMSKNITVYLSSNNEDVRGFYYYQRHNKAILLEGGIIEKSDTSVHAQLHEVDDKHASVDRPTWDITITPDHLTGAWSYQDKKNPLTLNN